MFLLKTNAIFFNKPNAFRTDSKFHHFISLHFITFFSKTASPKKITRSSQQTNHTSFLGICLKCFTFVQNTTGEVAAFAYEHMCENFSEKNLKGIDDAIKILEEKKSVLVKDLKAMQTSDQKDTIPNEEKQKKNELNDSGQNTPAMQKSDLNDAIPDGQEPQKSESFPKDTESITK